VTGARVRQAHSLMINQFEYMVDEDVLTDVETVIAEDSRVCNELFIDNANEGLNIFHMNIRSLSHNFNEFLILLQSFKFDIDIIILTESWELNNLNEFNIDGYNIYYNKSNYNKNDGVVVYANKKLVGSLDVQILNELAFSNLTFTYLNFSFSIIALYRPPSFSASLFLDNLDGFLSSNMGSQIQMLLGDINLNLATSNDNDVNNYKNIMSGHGFSSLINSPTRVTSTSASCLDHIYIRMQKIVKTSLKPVVLETHITDHYSTLLHIDFQGTSINSNKSPKFIKTVDFGIVEEYLKNEEWVDVYQESTSDSSYSCFIEKLQNYIDRGSVTIEIKNKRKKIKPWITDELVEAIKKRDKLKRRLKRYPGAELEREFKEFRNRLTKDIAIAKSSYYKIEILKAGKNIKKIWGTIKECTNMKQSGTSFVALQDDNQIITDQAVVVESFNDFFASVGSKMADKIMKENMNTSFYDTTTIRENIVDSLFLSPVTERELHQAICDININSATASDGVSAKLIKQFSKYLIPPLVYVINLSFQTGNFPYDLKKSDVIPVYKSGGRSDINNYRPISVVSQFAKIFEKTIASRLKNHLDFYNILSENQFGFRANRSTEDAIYTLTNSIYSTLNNNNKCLAIFLDLSKAFDSVSHTILLNKLERYGVRGLALRLFTSYLSDRKQRVRLGDDISSEKHVSYGVPQGTVLGPLLFTCYINDLLQYDVGGGIVSYADDTALIFSDGSWDAVRERAERGLYIVKTILNNHLLSLNYSKTKFLTFSYNIFNETNFNTLRMHWNCELNNCSCQDNIHSATEIKYLGVIVDKYLRWESHITFLCKRLRSLLYIFYQLRYSMQKSCLLMVYRSLVESVLQYGIIAWGGTYNNILHQCNVLQNLILKVIMFKDRLFPTEQLFLESNVLDIRGIYCLNSLKFLYRKPHLRMQVTHSYSTRQKVSEKLQVVRVNRTKNQRFINYIGPLIYNSLPMEIRRINNHKLFAKKVYSFLLVNRNLFYTIIKRL